MKIFSTNLKSVRQLTKYISLEEIEITRYNRYNASKIKAPNLKCDEFFRTEELFDRKNDIIRPCQQYSVDDLPVYDRMSLRAFHSRKLLGSNASYIESDLPYYVDIIGENKRIYIEDYGTKSPNHKYGVPVDFSMHSFWRHNENLYKNNTIDEVVNIAYYAHKLSKSNCHQIKLIALKMLKDGLPLEGVINIMKESQLKVTAGDSFVPANLMRFIFEYPKLRNYVITYSKDKNEVFDSNGAKIFPRLVDMCEGDTKKANKILWACRVEQADESYLTDLDLAELAKFMYHKDKTWNEEKTKILNKIKNKIPATQTKLLKRTYQYIEEGTPFSKIPELLTPYHMRGRSYL